ncbi:type II toxin-antitoxin system HicB family antitoxin [Spirosoma koreense]
MIKTIFIEYTMNLKVIVHNAEEGGYWAEVPAIPGCMTQGETLDELLTNLHEAVEGCLSVDIDEPTLDADARIMEIAV